MKLIFLAIPFILLLSGCNKPTGEACPTTKGAMEPSLRKKTPEGTLICEFYHTNSPKKVYWVNQQQLKAGNVYEYHENGLLKNKSQWAAGKKMGEELLYGDAGNLVGRYNYKKGVQDGNQFDFDKEGALKTHQLKRDGKLLYKGSFEGPKKISNQIFPMYVEEFFFEDKYYAKIKFPFSFAGKFDIQVNEVAEYRISPLEETMFQLVFNNALDLNDYTLNLTYQPGPADTLVYAVYPYHHTIYMND